MLKLPDIRSVPTSVHEEIISSLKKLLGNEVEIETLLDVESVCSEPSNEWIQKPLILFTLTLDLNLM